MAYIKRLVMHGFKSFARKTELPFSPGINVVLGPNGSGKSNITDALCFVLGRLSAKSMRATKSQNLIFMGTKVAGPAKEAVVEMVFDNEDRTFTVDSKEISIKRIVRKNGQSIYKINGETKTRQEILTLLAQAGIDPNGFNIILQGEIQNFVKMHNEERRKIIEEVSGISVYETRKEKSIKELNKTEEKLAEVLAILRERTSYLNNLEKERQQALKYKKLEEDIKKFKASIIYFDLTKKQKERETVQTQVSKKNFEIEKIKKTIASLESNISNFESKINSLNSEMQKSTGLEQEKLNQEIANLRADLAGMSVKKENFESKLSSIEKQKSELENLIRDNEVNIKELEKESPTVSKKQKEIGEKKKELEEIEEQRKKFYTIRSELKSIREKFEDKKSLLENNQGESDFILKQIDSISRDLYDKNATPEKVYELKNSLAEKKELLESLAGKEKELEKIAYTNEYEIDKQNKLIEKISKMDVCPVCKNRITESHIHSIRQETIPQIDVLKKEIEDSDQRLTDIYNKKEMIKQQIEQLTSEISKKENDLVRINSIQEKKDQIKSLHEKIIISKNELSEIEKIKNKLEKDYDNFSNIEQKYETLRVEFQEISIRTEENVNSEISFKQRELERSRISLKQLLREEVDIKEELSGLNKLINEKESFLEKKRKQEEELSKKFKKLIAERDSIQSKVRQNELELSEKKNHIHNIENLINNLKIEKARFDAEIENCETELLEFPNIEIIKTSRDVLVERLNKSQNVIYSMGSVNLRSLEVYEDIKKEYDSIKGRVETIEKEKEGILKIIHEIDIKKKKTFMKTFHELNEIFSRNFAQISTKGQVSLELENKKEPFEAGVGIIVKTGHGKYFEVTSLSGGEQTMVALSLIFAIQELNPYCFYILDEIDAALDKRNSERLANLLNKYMQKGQYIVITHNDEVITRATNLYGISMHDGISKVTSLKI
jgi:chromosome segregation protein